MAVIEAQVAAIPAVVTLADMGPWPTAAARKTTIEKTLWAEGVRTLRRG